METIPFFKPFISSEEESAVLKILHSGWLTTGSETLEFEKEFATFIGCKYALAVNSATSGLILAMDACGVEKGTKIITSPYTFASTATSAIHLGADVLYADICKDDYSIDPSKIEDLLKINKDVRAIVPIHIAGNVCDMQAINHLAQKYGVAVIEDAAHALPSKTTYGYAGTLGEAGVFSFYATKTITTAEGGMVCTNDAHVAERIKQMRLHGISKDVWQRYTDSKASWKYDVVSAGWKCNLPDILSAIGRVQLRRCNDLFESREKIANRYTEAFSQEPALVCPPNNNGNAWHLYILRIIPEMLKITRDDLITELQNRGIGMSIHFIPHCEMTFFKNKYNLQSSNFPETMKKFNASMSIPLWPGMTNTQIEYVISTILNVIKKNKV